MKNGQREPQAARPAIYVNFSAVQSITDGNTAIEKQVAFQINIETIVFNLYKFIVYYKWKTEK
jgi:hypothetical protein